MNHFVAPSPRGVAHGVYGEAHVPFERGTKGHPQAASDSDGRAPYSPTCYYAPDFDFESDEETTERTISDPPSLVVSSPQGSVLTGLDRPGPRVRFRSRVRISAGRRRRLSDESPVSSSPSSSISAPLRTHYTGSNGWSPLGTRVGSQRLRSATLFASRGEHANGAKQSPSEDGDWDVWEQDARPSEIARYDSVDEHTHLVTSTTRHFYASGRYYARDLYHQYHDDSEQRWKEQLMDEAFGKWPDRLLNRHWWWWHLEPILCCLCYPDEDE